MRILVISDLVRPNGAGVMALLGAEILTEAGHEVVVLAGSMDASLEQQLQHQHLSAASFTHDEKALDGSVTPSDHVAFLGAFRRWFDAQLDAWTPDVAYVHNCGRILTQLDLADLSCKLPLVHTMHDEWFYTDAHYTYVPSPGASVVRTFEPGRSENVLEHSYEHLFEVPSRMGHLVAIAPSDWLAQRASRVFPGLDVRHIPNAVDTALFDLQDRAIARNTLGLPADRDLVLFVGSPTQSRKGFELFEQSMRTVPQTGEAPVRVIAGGSASMVTEGFAASIAPGPIADNLAAPVASPLGALGVAGDALVVAGLDRSLMPALYGAADVLVHPSVIDNLPTVPIEAGLCGTSCLASNVGGTVETIADTNDLFDLDASAKSIGALIGAAIDDARTETVQDRQRRRDQQLSRFTVADHRSALLALFESFAVPVPS